MASKASTTVDVRLSQSQIDSIIEHVTEAAIEHRAAELVAERAGAIDAAARAEIAAEIMASIEDRAVRIARYSEYCSTFVFVWANIFPDGGYPRDNSGHTCDGWKLSEDRTTETDGYETRPARLKATDEWTYARDFDFDSDGRRRWVVETRKDLCTAAQLADA